MKLFRRIIIAIAALIAGYIGLMLLINAGAVMSSSRKIPEIEEVGTTLDDLVIPSDVRVVGIGEATHGNVEFQVAKLDMLKKMISDGNCRCIAFEISVGEGAMINSAIHGNGAHLTELVGELDYPLYDTQQIIDLLAWMREFNKGRSYDNSVMFYGIDMQGAYTSIEYLCEFAEVHPEAFKEGEIDKLTALADPDADYSEDKEFFENLHARLSKSTNTDYMIAAMAAGTVLQSIDSPSFDEDANAYGEYRDMCMALNVQAISGIEEHRGYSQVLVTAHNGHIMRGGAASYGETAMGQKIDDLFEGKYFCIGTEFYNTVVNIHTAGTYDEKYERKDHAYCSQDILAYQAKYYEGGKYVLVFDDVTEDYSRIYKLIHEDNFTGCAGEGYTIYMDLYKTYRLKMKVAERYDAMIYYYETTPIRCLHY